ncbi:hypothetical protein TIFTF001_022855 [Ficus carica]|uniref:Purple acid phosphatase n=1 Tax=Ficus carica TaxID=3494 RepID=A0AA88AWA5_FICCA|nr:hypothetical protein TIFTF001_022855 [Ficus carica]
MEPFSSTSNWFLNFFFNLQILVVLFFCPFSCSSSSSSSLHPLIAESQAIHHNHTAISDFRLVNRRKLGDCPDLNPYQQTINVSSGLKLGDQEFVTVTVSGVLFPSKLDWIGMISPSHSDVNSCPDSAINYLQTGDFSSLPLLCHYPVKAVLLSSDPDYLSCKKKECRKHKKGKCTAATCSGSVKFHVINIRTDIEFVFFSGGFLTPCIVARSSPLSFSNPNRALYGHISSIDSSGTSMRVTWVSGDDKPQQLQYDGGKTQASQVTTFTQNDMCRFIHSAVMSDLKPSTNFTYRYGSNSVGWSDQIQFKTPPAGGSDELKFLAYGDMGKAPRDVSVEHYIQFVLISRDYMEHGDVYFYPDSGGECGVPYETYFPMPTQAKDKPWYSIEQGSVHFTVISTEHDWQNNSEQYQWMNKDMASVDRSKTPWLVFMGHRPMYSSSPGLLGVDQNFVNEVEPLLTANKVDLVLFGHVHNYERTCSVYKNACLAMPKKDESGIDTYDHNNYTAPVHTVIGMAGFVLDQFPKTVNNTWSLKRISEFGYFRGHATKEELKLELVNAAKKNVKDSFRIIKKQDPSNRKMKIGR